MARKTALVVCPGRGVYNAGELGYLARYHGDKAHIIAGFDEQRRALDQDPVAALDAAQRFSVAKFTRGDNASALIYACSYADFLSIDRQAVDIVAVTGNSMGWYTALACAGALSAGNGFRVVNTMGTLMQDALIGGQMIYPFVDGDWRAVPGQCQALMDLVRDIPDLYVSIHLGGMIVFAGSEAALAEAEARLDPVDGRFPMRLGNHAAFHTPLQAPVSAKGRAVLGVDLFQQPDLPLVDGRGHVWLPKATALDALWDYTFRHQVLKPYDFTQAIVSGMREFAPDILIVLGPGTTLGGVTAQALIGAGWQGVESKADFQTVQDRAPILFAMGMDDQRASVVTTV